MTTMSASVVLIESPSPLPPVPNLDAQHARRIVGVGSSSSNCSIGSTTSKEAHHRIMKKTNSFSSHHHGKQQQQPQHPQQPAEPDLVLTLTASAQESVERAEALLRLVSSRDHPQNNPLLSDSSSPTNNTTKLNVEEALRLYKLAADTYQRLDATTTTTATPTSTTLTTVTKNANHHPNNSNTTATAITTTTSTTAPATKYQHRIHMAQCWLAMGDVLASQTDDREQALVRYLQAEQVLKQVYLQQQQQQQIMVSTASTTTNTGTTTGTTMNTISNGGSDSSDKATTTRTNADSDHHQDGRNSSSSTCSSTDDSSNIDVLIVEALEKRARVHADENAIGCYKDIVSFLLDVLVVQNNKTHTATSTATSSTTTSSSIASVGTHGNTTAARASPSQQYQLNKKQQPSLPLQPQVRLQQQHLRLLLQSLESLAKLYRQYPERVDLQVFEAALKVLRNFRKEQQQQDEGEDGNVVDENHHKKNSNNNNNNNNILPPLMGNILVTLASLYMVEDDLEAAFEALDEALDLLAPHDRAKALQSMDAVGTSFEESQLYDHAMACYEKALLIRSQLYGSNNILVAKSLINVARVMELQGNLEGSLDLYRAAQAIYTAKLADSSVDVEEDDFKTLLELFPTAMEQGRYEEAVAYLSKCIEVAEDEDNPCDNLAIDKTYIFYNLGKAYIGLKDYVSATICLLEAAKYEGEVSEEVVFALLQRVEFLQREAAAHKHATSTTPDSNGGSSSSFASKSSRTAASAGHPNMKPKHHGDPTEASAGLPISLVVSDNNMIKRTIKNLTPLTSDMSCGASKVDEDNDSNEDEGTAYYDSESVSVFDPIPKSDISSSLFESDMLLSDALADSLLDSDALVDDAVHPNRNPRRYPDVRGGGGGGVIHPSVSELTGSHMDTPEGDSSHLLDDIDFGDGKLHHTDGVNTRTHHENRTFSGFRLRLGSPRSRPDKTTNGFVAVDDTAAPETNNNNSSHPRTSLAKTLTGKFRRQRRSGAGFSNEMSALTDPLVQISLTPTSEEEEKSPSEVKSSLPSEEEYHSAIEGPVQYVTFRSKSFESCISQITLRFDDPTRAKDTTQEWWWNVTTEGFARWFPTSISKAVEAAEGFLSAKSIHSKVKEAPLEYVSDEEESVEEEKASTGEIVDHPSYVGVADSRTMLSGLDGKKARARIAEARKRAARRAKSDGALSVASGRPNRQPTYLESEIARYSDLLDSQRAKYGKLHPDVATSMFTLAVLYSRNGAAAPAIEYAAEALGIQKATGKLDDASRSLHFLADMYLHQRQYSTALTFYTEGLRLERNHYGDVSDEAAMTLNCIGTVYSLQNEFLNAMESHQEALRILQLVHDGDLKHPHISETLCQIGAVYYRDRNAFSKTQGLTEEHHTTFVETGMLETIGRAHEDRGSYKMAISFFEEKLQLMETRGPIASADDLEEVATTLNSLGMLSSRAGFYVEAIDYYEKALKIQLKLGCDKVQLATARVLTGAVHFQLGDWQKALKLHQEALVVLRKELGTEHQTYAAALYQLAIVREALCEFDTAMNLLKQALGIQTRLLGMDQPATLRTRREIANIYTLFKSSSTVGLEQLDAVLACQRLIHGDRHPNIAETLLSIGRAYSRIGDISSAIQVLEECYYMRTEFLGWDHPQQATTLHEICQLHLKRGRTKKALHILDVVIGILRESLSDDHIDVALALGTKASCLIEEGKIEGARKALKEALRIAEETVGPKHPSLADLYVQMGTLQMRQCQFDAARSAIEKAIEIYSFSDVSDEYPGLVDALEKLNRVHRDEMLCV